MLYRQGGVYIDIDSRIVKPLDSFLRFDDVAVIAPEGNPGLWVQWALMYEAGHPFLKRALQLSLDNIAHNRYPHDVHRMTGPSIYSEAIRACLVENPRLAYRQMGVDYEGCLGFKYPLSKWLYRQGEHWSKEQRKKPVLRAA